MTVRTVGTARTARRSGARTRLARALGALAVTTAGLAGCSTPGGAAAVVEGEEISVAEVHRATEELGPYLQDANPSSVLLLLVAEPTFERVARDNGIGVSDAEARDVLDGLAAGAAAEGGPAAEGGAAAEATEFGSGSVSVARFTLLQQRLQESPEGPALLEQVTTELADLDVEINPRYGEIDFAAGTGITPVQHSWLVGADTP